MHFFTFNNRQTNELPFSKVLFEAAQIQITHFKSIKFIPIQTN